MKMLASVSASAAPLIADPPHQPMLVTQILCRPGWHSSTCAAVPLGRRLSSMSLESLIRECCNFVGPAPTFHPSDQHHHTITTPLASQTQKLIQDAVFYPHSRRCCSCGYCTRLRQSHCYPLPRYRQPGRERPRQSHCPVLYPELGRHGRHVRASRQGLALMWGVCRRGLSIP